MSADRRSSAVQMTMTTGRERTRRRITWAVAVVVLLAAAMLALGGRSAASSATDPVDVEQRPRRARA
jgi:hypothetical protein